MLSRTGMLCIMIIGFSMNIQAQEATTENRMAAMEAKMEILSEMTGELQALMLEVLERLQENQKVTQDILNVLKSDDGIYAAHKNKLDFIVKSCSEMIKENGETIYKCKIKLNDEGQKQEN